MYSVFGYNEETTIEIKENKKQTNNIQFECGKPSFNHHICLFELFDQGIHFISDNIYFGFEIKLNEKQQKIIPFYLLFHISSLQFSFIKYEPTTRIFFDWSKSNDYFFKIYSQTEDGICHIQLNLLLNAINVDYDHVT